MCCRRHNLSLYLSQSDCPEIGVLTVKALFEKQESRWIAWRVFQVPADHVTHSLGGMQSIVNWTSAKSPESAAQRDWREAEDNICDRPQSQIIPLFLCSLEKLAPIQTGCKAICAPCVRRWSHQAVVGWSGHDPCSQLLGTARAWRQKARRHGNETSGIYTAKF